ncbi:M28 family metallopeptidase [Nocardioides sp.]|uniref:M28 family metallopeptidase n=1 Tax=Nocardioides sp. TaxID=35761 RepID=UPI002B27B630|nr:M28 family metallopeptidase [Nocardioides sp.]
MRVKTTLFGASALVMALVGAPSTTTAQAASNACDQRTNNTYKKLLECVTLEGAREHQWELQKIADANNGNRTSGTSGYDASADYAVEVFEDAGLEVSVQEFVFQTFIKLSPTVLERVSPAPAGAIETAVMSYSGSGDVTAPVSSPSAVTGCSPTDFAGFTQGDIALISRGACTFAAKANNADAAGAAGVVIYNNIPGALNGTLGSTFTADLPVTSVTQAVGQELAAVSDLTLRLKADTFRGEATTSNVIAETPWGNPDNVVMVGAHLDSVNEGPGIQDDGSGVAGILETAQNMRKSNGVNQVRFALWGAEESGLVGSTYYVDNLPQVERDKVALYLNFDMIGSPNHVFFVYDGDDSDGVGAGPGPEGSDQIEKLFESYYAGTGNSWKGTDFSGRSDYGPFIAEGVDIPSGGLFTGAEGIKTPQEAEIWGGTAGEQYDPCYHLACDDYDNINLEAFDVNVDAIAFSTLTYAYSTESVNGEKGKKVPGGPSGGSGSSGAAGYPGGSSGGLHSDEHEHVSE